MQHAEKTPKSQAETVQRRSAAEHASASAAHQDSPRLVAQRQQLHSLFGPAVQRHAAAEEELPAQGRFVHQPAQRQAMGDEEEAPVQGRSEAVQRQAIEEEEPLQRQATEEEEPLQRQAGPAAAPQQAAAAPNRTGLPDGLKSGIESLSGMSMDHVRVHYNSPQPAQLQAHAYAQGSEIHLAPGQEQHLPHEAWHVVQQAQGRVRPTTQAKGRAVNDDAGLEREADLMGEQALSSARQGEPVQARSVAGAGSATVQRFGDKVAVEFKKELAEGLQPLQEGLQSIYATYRQDKKDKRNKIEDQYHAGSKKLLERQEYLSFRMRAKLYEMANEKNKDLKFDTAHALSESDKIELPDRDKIELNVQALHLAKEHFKAFKASMGEDVIDREGDRLHEQRVEEIAEWERGPRTSTKPKAKSEVVARKDAVANIKSSINSMAKAVAYHELGDKLVQDHEAGYMTSAFRKTDLIRLWTTFAKKQGYLLITDTSEDDLIELFVSKRKGGSGKMVGIGTIYENDQRFVKTSEHVLSDSMQDPETREIFTHRESGKEYVQDAHDTFVKRYVSRALNKHDVSVDDQGVADVHIGADPRTKTGTGQKWEAIAQELAEGNDKGTNMKEVFKHQRQKEAQGGSPFISFTTTEHDIFGSTGMNFEGEHGKALVDLAKISKNRIIDTHTPDAFHEITGVRRPDPYMPFSDDPMVSRNSAARDSMRTRELVVLGNMGIPPEAIESYRRKEGGRGGESEPIDFMRSGGKFHHPVTSEHAYRMALATGTMEERLHGDRGAGTSDIHFTEDDWK
jgi:hypothetical protein